MRYALILRLRAVIVKPHYPVSCATNLFGSVIRNVALLTGLICQIFVIPHATGRSLDTERSSSVSISSLPHSFTALRLDYNRFDSHSLRKSTVNVSPEGIRVADIRGSKEQTRNLFIQNFQLDTAWLVSASRGVYVSLQPAQKSPADDAYYPPVNESDSDVSAGVLSSEPCLNMTGQMIGTSRWRGWNVEIWTCNGKTNSAQLKQMFSLEWGMVVREERSSGAIAELHNIRKMKFASDWFKPKSDFQEVEFNEFAYGLSSLTNYPESGTYPKQQ